MADVVFNPSSGSNNKEVEVSGTCNSGTDQVFEYKVATLGGEVEVGIVVNFEGKRESLSAKDGDDQVLFLTSDGGTFDVVKEKWVNDPDCPI